MPKRPPVPLSPEEREQIVKHRSVGMTFTRIALHIGCARSTISRLRKRDPDFEARLRQATGNLEARLLANVIQAGGKSWRASAWALERLFPQQYEKRKPNELGSFEEISEAFDDIVDTLIRHVPRENRVAARAEIDAYVDSFARGKKRDKRPVDAASRRIPPRHSGQFRDAASAEGEACSTRQDAASTKAAGRKPSGRRTAAIHPAPSDAKLPRSHAPRGDDACRRSASSERTDDARRSRTRSVSCAVPTQSVGTRDGYTEREETFVMPRFFPASSQFTAGVELPIEPWPGMLDGAPAPVDGADLNPAPWPGYFAGAKAPPEMSPEEVRQKVDECHRIAEAAREAWRAATIAREQAEADALVAAARGGKAPALPTGDAMDAGSALDTELQSSQSGSFAATARGGKAPALPTGSALAAARRTMSLLSPLLLAFVLFAAASCAPHASKSAFAQSSAVAFQQSQPSSRAKRPR